MTAGTTEAGASVLDYAATLRRRWPYLVLIFPAVMLVAVYLAYTLPPVYRASATILLEPSAISADLVETTVISAADQRIELVQRRVLATDKLKELVAEFDPYPDAKDLSPQDKAQQALWDTEIERVDPITLEPLVESNAFSIHYHNADPDRAAEVARRLADLFLAYNQQMRAEAAEEARRFLLQQSELLAAEVKQLDQSLANFKRRHGDALPEAQARNLAAVDRAERDLEATEGQIRVAEEQEALLALQLGQLSPTIAGPVSDWATLKAELADAEQRYTPDHPDVKRLRKAIASLTAQHAGGSGADAGSAVPDNPEYLRVQSQHDAVRRELAALRASAAKARSQIGSYQGRLAMTPTVEEEYVQLTRQRDLNQKQFLEIQDKLRQAELAENLETEQHGERFTLIREPFAPDAPFAPNRLGILLMGFVLGAGLAAAAVVVREILDQTVRGSSDLAAVLDAPVLASVPLMVSEADRRRTKVMWGWISLAYTAAAIFVVVSVLAAGH
jgi:succinoglycan biosynthesis transport protein ExoP